MPVTREELCEALGVTEDELQSVVNVAKAYTILNYDAQAMLGGIAMAGLMAQIESQKALIDKTRIEVSQQASNADTTIQGMEATLVSLEERKRRLASGDLTAA